MGITRVPRTGFPELCYDHTGRDLWVTLHAQREYHHGLDHGNDCCWRDGIC